MYEYYLYKDQCNKKLGEMGETVNLYGYIVNDKVQPCCNEIFMDYCQWAIIDERSLKSTQQQGDG